MPNLEETILSYDNMSKMTRLLQYLILKEKRFERRYNTDLKILINYSHIQITIEKKIIGNIILKHYEKIFVN